MSTSATKAPDAPVWMRRGDDSPRSWGRERDPGSAFRDVTRGRGRGGSAPRGRQGGRGAGGRNVSARGVPDVKSTPPSLPEKTGQKFPTLSMNGQVSESSDSLAPPLSPSRPSRRRRNTNRRSASAAVPKPIPTALTDVLTSSPSAPLVPSSTDAKDFTRIEKPLNSNEQVHDLRQDIASLVDHVRTMAMENKRPHSPATHIDWAGEDDDSLPDLDDWGVSSKLTSDIGESSTRTDSKLLVESTSVSVANPEKHEAKDEAVVRVITDQAQSSAESPTELSMSLSVQPPVKRVRERRRGGGRREREKRNARLNVSQDSTASIPTVPKKSLLERISSPVRPESTPLPENSSSATPSGRRIPESKSGSSLTRPTTLPPKPQSLPKKPSSPGKNTDSWRKKTIEGALDKALEPSAEPTPSSVVEQKPLNNHEPQATPHPKAEDDTDSAKPNNNSSFDWSEEPLSLDSSGKRPVELAISVESSTPLTNAVAEAPVSPRPSSSSLAADNSDTKSDISVSPRLRSQRPLSGDATPRSQARDRSPYKTHNPRNHSAPNAGHSPSPGGRMRPQHASRPILRMDALAMISRSLRESPPPPRRESPPARKVAQ